MIFAADPHPVATYVAGWFFLIAIAVLCERIFRRDLGGNWPRIWRLFLANFDSQRLHPTTKTGERM